MKLIYISAPYAKNPEKFTNWVKEEAKQFYEAGNLPIIPHIQFPYLKDDADRDIVMCMLIELMKKCDEVIFYKFNVYSCNHQLTSGQKAEKLICDRYNIKYREIIKNITEAIDEDLCPSHYSGTYIQSPNRTGYFEDVSYENCPLIVKSKED